MELAKDWAVPAGRLAAGLCAAFIFIGERPCLGGGPPEEIRIGILGERGVVFRDDPPWRLTEHVSAAGDVNGDGLADFLLLSQNQQADYDQKVVLAYGRRDLPQAPRMEDLLAGATVLRRSSPRFSSVDLVDGMAPAGDVDADGYEDFLVLRPYGGPDEGAVEGSLPGLVYLVHGGPTLPSDIPLDHPPADVRIACFTSTRPARTGLARASDFGGDFSGDGLPDLVFGADFADPDDGAEDKGGRVYVLLGGQPFSGLIDVEEGGGRRPGFILEGDAHGEDLGRSVKFLGDVNGDGVGDLLVGAPSRHGWVSGSAYLVYGGAEAPPLKIGVAVVAGRAVRFEGGGSAARTGKTLTAPGDLNGDGLADLVIGAPGASNQTGEVYVIYGRKEFPQSVLLHDIDSSGLGTIFRGEPGQGPLTQDAAAGCSLGVLRYSGDEKLDIMIGSLMYEDRGVKSVGRAYILQGGAFAPGVRSLGEILSGQLAGSAFTAEAEEWFTGSRDWLGGIGQSFGEGCAAPGDVNGDGREDLLLSAPASFRDDLRPAVYLVFGNAGDPGPLAIERLLPSAVSLEGGTEVALLGGGFDASLRLLAGSREALVKRIETTARFIFEAPPGEALGSVDIVVQRGAESARLSGALRYVPRVYPDIDARNLVTSGRGMVVQSVRAPLATADLDGDGFADIVAGCAAGSGLFILWGRSAPPAEMQLPDCGESLAGASFILCHQSLDGHAPFAVGDVNADGREDLAVVSPSVVTIIFGGDRLADGASLDDFLQQGRAARILYGTSWCGPVAGGADFDGDGVGDLAVTFNSGPWKKVCIVTGSRSWPAEQFLQVAPGFMSLVSDDNLGKGLAVLEDVNADGLGEIVVGAPGQSWRDDGHAYLIYGTEVPADELVENLVATEGATRLESYKRDDSLGYKTCSLGDFNGDKVADFAVSAYMGGPAFSGESYIIFGGERLEPIPILSMADLGSNGLRISGEWAYDYACRIAPAGDFNGDGLADLAIGAGTSRLPPRAYVIFGGPARPIQLEDLGADGVRITQLSSSPQVFQGGDINGDGLGDVLVWLEPPGGWAGTLLAVFGRGPEVAFLRGDSNADGAAAISDAIHLLNHLFLGGPAPPCADAADSNDDAKLDITDAVYLLGHLFLGGRPPPAPYPTCGKDPTDDALGCAGPVRCP